MFARYVRLVYERLRREGLGWVCGPSSLHTLNHRHQQAIVYIPLQWLPHFTLLGALALRMPLCSLYGDVYCVQCRWLADRVHEPPGVRGRKTLD